MTARAWLKPTLVSGLVVVGLAGLSVALRRDPRRPPLETLPADMVRTPAAVTNGRAAALPGGFVELPPPAGAVPHGGDVPTFGPSLEEAARAGRELVNPAAATPAVVARGAVVWANACVVCHGAAGRGDAPVTKLGFPPPPTLVRAESRALADGEVFHAITYGRKNMPSAALQVEVADRWCVIRYLRTLQEAK